MDAVKGNTSVLTGTDWMFVWRGAVLGWPAKEYAGPYKVLQRSKKVVELQVGDCVSRG